MDAYEAFCIAVKFYRSGEWSPALPARNTINVDGKDLTLRQVCSLVEHVTRPLPDSVVSDLFTSLCERHPRLEKAVNRSHLRARRWMPASPDGRIRKGSLVLREPS
jgi:hypothetical protein